jgi:hypothetical protein
VTGFRTLNVMVTSFRIISLWSGGAAADRSDSKVDLSGQAAIFNWMGSFVLSILSHTSNTLSVSLSGPTDDWMYGCRDRNRWVFPEKVEGRDRVYRVCTRSVRILVVDAVCVWKIYAW